MRIIVLVGNPKANSRTRALGEAVGDAISHVVARMFGDIVRSTIELSDHAASVFDPHDPQLVALTQEVAASDVLIVATPTYKAAYTGLLKAFLDRYETNGLAGTLAVPIMTGGSPAHALAPDFTLRPLLVELGASVPTRSLFVMPEQMPQLAEIVTSWTAVNRAALVGAVRNG